MNQLTRRFVDRNEVIVPIENFQGHYRLRVRPVFRRGPLFLSLGFLC